MCRNASKRIALFAVLALGLAAGGLAIYNRVHRPPPVAPLKDNPESTERPIRTKPRLPAALLSARLTRSEPEPDSRRTNLFTRILKGLEFPKVTLEQVDSYLTANRRCAGSLLGAFQATGDTNLLEEAKAKYPNDPAVAYTASYKTDSPGERRQWLEALKRAAPENALANYLSASEHLKAGRTDDALNELEAAHAKTKLQDYGLQRMQDAEEAYRSAGYSEAEAKAVAMMSLELPQLAPLKQLTQRMVELATSYRQAGDPASADAALQLGAELGQRLDTGENTIIQDLVGIAVQKIALGAMDPTAPYGTGGQTVKDHLDQLAQQRQAIKSLVEPSDQMLQSLPEQEVVTYFERLKLFGEHQTLQWLIAKYGKE